MHKTIQTDLTVESIDRAIRELERFKADFSDRVDILRQRIAEEVAMKAQIGFSGSDSERSWRPSEKGSYETQKADVSVTTMDKGGNVTVVIAKGEDAVWVEFGTGVHYNGEAGSSPNPWGVPNKLTIGSYGKGNGQKDAWGYADDSGYHRTHGVPATMPMYHASESIARDIYKIAKEVFG